MSANTLLKLDLEEIESDGLPLKLSALTHAARIPKYQSKFSLGPAKTDGSDFSTFTPSTKPPSTAAPKRDSPKTARSPKDIPTPSIRHKPIDYEIYDRYGMLKQAEKQRKDTVRQELEEKRRKFLMQQKAKNQQSLHQSGVESANDIKCRLEQLIIQESENLAAQLNEENERRLRQQNEEHHRRIEQIKSQQAVRHNAQCRATVDSGIMKFVGMYEEFSKRFRASKPTERLEKLKHTVHALVMKFNAFHEKLKKSPNDVDAADVEYAEQLNDELDALQKQFEIDCAAETTVVDSPAAFNVQPEVVAQQQQSQTFVQDQTASAEQPQSNAKSSGGGQENSGLNRYVSSENFAFYNTIMAFYTSKVESVKPLQANETMKKYRSNCQKAINIPVNAISAVSAEHLQDKYDKLFGLISGAKVNTPDGQISAMDHPLGRDFCLLLLAKKFVSQGDTTVSSNLQAAFPIAAIIVSIWQKVPEFGQLFLAYAFKESPYLVPYFMPHLQGQSIEEYFKTLGYRYSNGVMESHDMYLKRQSGLVKLYAAVMVTKPRAKDGSTHPYGIDNGWRWLNNMLNLEPLPDICATLILGFLQTAGFEMLRVYRGQFMKLLKIMHNQYMERLSKVEDRGPKARLEVFLMNVLRENAIEKPPGLLAANFW